MPTDKPRLNVVLEPPLYLKVKKLAKKDGVSLSLKARDLIKESIDYEDAYLLKKVIAKNKTLVRTKAFLRIRENLVPKARAKGIFTDEDVAKKLNRK